MSAAAAKRTVLAAASVLTLLAVVVVGPAGGAAGGKEDRNPPSPPGNPHVTGATPKQVGLAWDPAQDDVAVAGYYVYGDTGRATVAGTSYTVTTLDCGQSSVVAVAAFDRSGNRSPKVWTTVATAACPDIQPPSSPSGFVQSATTQTGVVLTWSPSTDDVGVVGYGVYRSSTRVASPGEPSVTLTGLSCGSTYSYGVDAVDATGNRSPIATTFVQTASCADGQPPTQPSGLAVASRGTDSLSLTWTASSDNVGVSGYRVSLNGSPVTTVSQPGAVLGGLACATTYTVAVDAFDAAGNRSPASSISAATDACPPPPPTADTTPPTTPTGLAVSNVTQSGMTIAWNVSTDNVGVTGYDVSRNGTKVATVSGTSTAQTGLSCGTSYTFAVVARDAAGNSSQAGQLVAATAACSPPPPTADTTPPSQPSGLSVAGVTSTSVTLAWGASSDNVGVAGYRAYVNGSAGATTTQTSATISGLTCGTAYTLEVDSYDAAGNRSTRASVVRSTAACPDSQPPSVPANVVTTSRTATSIALAWTASSDNTGVTGYGLYRGTTLVGTSGTTSGIFSGLTCNTSYTLAVDAYDAAGNRSSKATTLVSTTACPDTTPPSTPTGLAASNVTQTDLTLSWNASTDNVGVTGYDVYRGTTKMATVTSTSTTQTGLACGTAYSFGVIARDAAGNSSAQASLQVTTSACSPPPPSTGTAIDSLGDLDGAWVPNWVDPVPNGVSNPTGLGGGIWEVSTPHGPGFRFVATPEMPTPWDSTMKHAYVRLNETAAEGVVEDWRFKFMLPSSGNPDGFVPPSLPWNGGILFENGHTNLASGHELAIRNGQLCLQVHKAPWTNSDYDVIWLGPPKLDHWYDVRNLVKWSTGSQGYTKWWIDSQQVVDRAGPTYGAGHLPWPQFGWYSMREFRNEVVFAGIQRS